MNRKGFTLIELLATLVILSIIMTVAVPNVMSTVDKNKKRTYVEDAKKMVTLAEYRINKDVSIPKPTSGKCIVITLSALDLTEFDEGPEGGDYDFNHSYVIMKNTGSEYQYFVTLYEKYDSNKIKGIEKANRNDLSKENALTNVKSFTSTPNVDNAIVNSLSCTLATSIINYQ